MKKIIFNFFMIVVLLSVPLIVTGQEDETGSPVNVFLDARNIDSEYIREEFTKVNYVRTKEASNVHILGTVQSTGAGAHYQFFFMGYGDFAGKNDTLHYYSSSLSTSAEIKEGYTRVIVTGLIHYLALANEYVDFVISDSETNRGGATVEDDPWNSWVFDVGVQGNISGESSRKTETFESSLNITKVTPEWRYEFRFDYETRKRIFQYEDYYSETKTLQSAGRYWIVKSLGPNAGAGVIGSVQRNTVNNYDFNNVSAIAMEYNFFPYDMSSRRELLLSYRAGIDYRNYTDSTVYDKLIETISYESLELGYSQREQWGNVNATVNFRHFFRDFSENKLSLNGSVNLRVWKGLSWNFSVRYSLINDDVNISKSDVDPEDIMLGLRSLSTSSSYNVRTGISWTFGSMYNNVVNTRLR